MDDPGTPTEEIVETNTCIMSVFNSNPKYTIYLDQQIIQSMNNKYEGGIKVYAEKKKLCRSNGLYMIVHSTKKESRHFFNSNYIIYIHVLNQ